MKIGQTFVFKGLSEDNKDPLKSKTKLNPKHPTKNPEQDFNNYGNICHTHVEKINTVIICF